MKKRVMSEMPVRNHSLFSIIKSANFFIRAPALLEKFVKLPVHRVGLKRHEPAKGISLGATQPMQLPDSFSA
jgi:hypothetical protein